MIICEDLRQLTIYWTIGEDPTAVDLLREHIENCPDCQAEKQQHRQPCLETERERFGRRMIERFGVPFGTLEMERDL